ncbi:hypothetical protein C7U61_03010 [Rhizobium sp. JAB6]|uniref:hypothetical protein n=1 Tax=Rhizobium sp. JAB6 TaxID=2127050 RepID=UPI000D1169B3|nr:hypothetical protein [Rhizobium sp. JAB6]PST23503.1 hypothetical protein C7U61_03010 [Rhizobium sp. JAB6]
MRNFGSRETAFAEVSAEAARFSAAFGGGLNVTRVSCGNRPSVADDDLVYFAGLAPTGYSDTCSASSADLSR